MDHLISTRQKPIQMVAKAYLSHLEDQSVQYLIFLLSMQQSEKKINDRKLQ